MANLVPPNGSESGSGSVGGRQVGVGVGVRKLVRGEPTSDLKWAESGLAGRRHVKYLHLLNKALIRIASIFITYLCFQENRNMDTYVRDMVTT
jgi:hypothetical protein